MQAIKFPVMALEIDDIQVIDIRFCDQKSS